MTDLSNHSDHELIASYRAGNENALDVLVHRYVPIVYRFVYRWVGNQRDAEDITQDVFIKIWKNMGRYDTTQPFKPWLFQIARNTCIDVARKRTDIPFSAFDAEQESAITDTLQDLAPLPAEIMERAEVRDQLESILLKLPEIDRTILILHHIQELTFQEIGTVMHSSLNTVKSRYRRATITLRRLLTEESGHAPKSPPDT